MFFLKLYFLTDVMSSYSVPAYPRSSSKRDLVRRDDLPPRSRVAVDYGARAALERRSSYKDDFVPRRSSYSDVEPPASARVAPRRAYVDETYERRFERPPPSYRGEGRARDYDSISGSKRPYSALVSVFISIYFSEWLLHLLLFVLLFNVQAA